MSKGIENGVDTAWFELKAAENDWGAFDSRVKEVCDMEPWLKWTDTGMGSPELNERDLAISILENTQTPLSDGRTTKLIEIMSGDTNLHLRRKAAIALWRHGNRGEEVVEQLEEALVDDELRDEVAELLSKVRE